MLFWSSDVSSNKACLHTDALVARRVDPSPNSTHQRANQSLELVLQRLKSEPLGFFSSLASSCCQDEG